MDNRIAKYRSSDIRWKDIKVNKPSASKMLHLDEKVEEAKKYIPNMDMIALNKKITQAIYSMNRYSEAEVMPIVDMMMEADREAEAILLRQLCKSIVDIDSQTDYSVSCLSSRYRVLGNSKQKIRRQIMAHIKQIEMMRADLQEIESLILGFKQEAQFKITHAESVMEGESSYTVDKIYDRHVRLIKSVHNNYKFYQTKYPEYNALVDKALPIKMFSDHFIQDGLHYKISHHVAHWDRIGNIMAIIMESLFEIPRNDVRREAIRA